MRRKPASRDSIRLLVLDVDGVMTDGRLYYGSGGEVLKVFHVHDGYGVRAIAEAGIEVAVISGRKSAMVARRCGDLGIRHVIQGHDAKLPRLLKLLKRLRLELAECACVGDDRIDVPLLEATGLSFAVANAHPSARRAAHIVTKLRGGRGAVREVCDYLLAGRKR